MDTESKIEENTINNQIKETESRILLAESDLNLLKEQLSLLREKQADDTIIEWRSELKKCLRGNEDQPIFTSYDIILNKIESQYGITASTKIKSSVIKNLSALFKEGIIGRTEHDNIYYYGLGELFLENDLSVVKKEFQSLFNECRVYVENFEREA